MSGDLNPFAKVSIGSVVKASPRFKHTISPVWEFPAEFLVPDKANSIVTLKVVDDRDFLKDPMIGYMSIKLTDLLAAKDNQRDWFPLSGCKSGRVRISAEWKPLEMAGGVHGANHYLPPIGVVRIWSVFRYC